MSDIFEANGAKFYAKDDMIIRHIRTGKKFEPITTPWLFEHLSENRTYVDVGHSTGWFAIPVALRGYDVIGVEPFPNAIKRAYENMELNGVNYHIIEAAASNKSESDCVFRYNERLPLTSGSSLEKDSLGRSIMTVDTVTLDEVLIGVDVGFLKVDVEGHEISVLEGAQNTIDRCRPYMILEANTPRHEEVLSEWLITNQYSWKNADGRNMLCVPE